MASGSQQIEIGWKKELLEDAKGKDNSAKETRLRSRDRKKKHYHRLSSESSTSRSTSADSSGSSTIDTSSDNSLTAAPQNAALDKKQLKKQERHEKHELKKLKKEQRRAEKERVKKAKREKRKEAKRLKKTHKKMKEVDDSPDNTGCDFSVPIELMYSKARAPETPAEYEARQSKIRRVQDPETGRTRLIKGDGEILEEIVTRDRHQEINRSATQGDGDFFQIKTVGRSVNK